MQTDPLTEQRAAQLRSMLDSFKKPATACRFEYDPIASNADRVVTICRHCGEARVTPMPSQMETWTQPPARWIDRMPYVRPRVFD